MLVAIATVPLGAIYICRAPPSSVPTLGLYHPQYSFGCYIMAFLSTTSQAIEAALYVVTASLLSYWYLASPFE